MQACRVDRRERPKRAMKSTGDDVSWSEIAAKLKIIGSVVALLILAELAYRWMTAPDDTFLLYQQLIAWIWFNLHSLLFGSDTIAYYAIESEPRKVLEFFHPSLVGSEIPPLDITDECVALHEIAFVSFLIWMTPGVSAREKWRGILTMAGVITVLNIVRLVVLYPLAVKGCVANPGEYGCWAPMWEFHQFMLDYGFMMVILLGWTGWYLAVGGPAKTRDMGSSGMFFAMPKNISARKVLPTWSKGLLALALLLAVRATYILAFDDWTEQLRMVAEGCDPILTPALCAAQNGEFANVTDLAWRSIIVATVMGLFATVKIDWEHHDDAASIDDEEE